MSDHESDDMYLYHMQDLDSESQMELANLREQLALSEANADQYRQQFELANLLIDGLEAQVKARHERVGELTGDIEKFIRALNAQTENFNNCRDWLEKDRETIAGLQAGVAALRSELDKKTRQAEDRNEWKRRYFSRAHYATITETPFALDENGNPLRPVFVAPDTSDSEPTQLDGDGHLLHRDGGGNWEGEQ